jgi:replicative DNA helicase
MPKIARPKVEWRSFADAYADRVTQLEEWAVKKSEGTLRPEDLYIPTGLRKWDANGGVTRGVLTVLGGVDGQGKSFVKKHLATAAAQRGLRVAMIDFEDPEAKTMDREIASRTHIDSRKLGLATFDPMDLDKIFASLDEVRKWGGLISYHAGLVGVDEIVEALDAMDPKPDLVLLDYAQALPDDEGEGLERTIAKLAWWSNVYAQRANCGFVVFSQVKPEVSNRGHAAFWASKKRDPDSFDVSGFYPGPGTQDLAWSSAFGQRGRAVGYIVRPGYYEKALGKPGALDNRLDIRWAKVTFGNSGMMELGFDGPSGRIFDRAEL